MDEGAQDASLAVSALSAEEILPSRFAWETVANNATVIPDATGKKFSSYNQPSVNGRGLVVFRARSKGSDGGSAEPSTLAAAADPGPVRGIFTRDMANRLAPGAIATLVRTGDEVPQPNNVKNPGPATFNEFPSIPRIDLMTKTIATRGQSKPVYEFVTDASGGTSRIGTSGVYASPGGGPLFTGASLVGAATDFATGALQFPQFQVPGAAPGTRFDQFPGAPGVAGAIPGVAGSTAIVFKGNWTDLTDPANPVGRTGVYFRDVRAADSGGARPVVRIADSYTRKIPGHDTVFGSTAPPSGAKGYMVFVGFDDEQNPTKGGVYRAPLVSDPKLQALVKIGDRVKDFKGENIHVPGTRTPYTFTRFGEGLSFDGRYVAFWAAWGPETRTIELTCPADGNKAVIQYCMEHSLVVDGIPTGKYLETVPVNQGLFVYDTAKGKFAMAARSGAYFKDFLFWNYSGRPPGTGEGGDEGGEDTFEPPRWRSNAFSAVNAPRSNETCYRLAFKAVRPDGGAGIYMAGGPETRESAFKVVVDTRTSAWAIDPGAPPADESGTTALLVTSMGIERDSFRGDGRKDGTSFLTINVGMASADASVTWAGIYVARISNDD
ncbi:MAG: hypothetical protein WB493_12035 [Anaeromyxobacteraceae bacterium]